MSYSHHILFLVGRGVGGVAIKDTLKSIEYGQVSRAYFLLFIAMTNPRTESKEQILELFPMSYHISTHQFVIPVISPTSLFPLLFFLLTSLFPLSFFLLTLLFPLLFFLLLLLFPLLFFLLTALFPLHFFSSRRLCPIWAILIPFWLKSSLSLFPMLTIFFLTWLMIRR